MMEDAVTDDPTLDEVLGLFLVAFDEARGTAGETSLDRGAVNGLILRLGAELADGALAVWADPEDSGAPQPVPPAAWAQCFDEGVEDDESLGSLGESFLTGRLTGACFGRLQGCTPRFRRGDLLGRVPDLLGRAEDPASP